MRLCSLPDRERFILEGGTRTRKLDINASSVELLRDELQEGPCPEDAAFAHVELSRVVRAYSGELQLHESERSQLHFWRSYSNVSLEVPFVVFTVLTHASLVGGPKHLRPPGRQGKSRSFFRAVPGTFASRHAVHDAAKGKRPGEAQSQLALCLPAAMAVCVANGSWKHILLPTRFPISIGWSLLQKNWHHSNFRGGRTV